VLGHASPETTWRYAQINLEMKRQAIESYASIGAKLGSPMPIWHRQPDILAELEAIGRRRDYVLGRSASKTVRSPKLKRRE
jgi:hypothetical protein